MLLGWWHSVSEPLLKGLRAEGCLAWSLAHSRYSAATQEGCSDGGDLETAHTW